MGAAALDRARLIGAPERYARRLETIIQSMLEHHDRRTA
jgi:lipopolysaccharide biosynthesis glycosyltransferase